MTARTATQRSRAAAGWRLLLVAAVVVNLAVVYAPSSPGTGGIPYVDKVVHFAIFAAVAFCGRRAGVPAPLLLGALLVHAVSSEIVQESLLAQRSGDVWDAVADTAGSSAGWLAAGWLAARRLGARPLPRRAPTGRSGSMRP